MQFQANQTVGWHCAIGARMLYRRHAASATHTCLINSCYWLAGWTFMLLSPLAWSWMPSNIYLYCGVPGFSSLIDCLGGLWHCFQRFYGQEHKVKLVSMTRARVFIIDWLLGWNLTLLSVLLHPGKQSQISVHEKGQVFIIDWLLGWNQRCFQRFFSCIYGDSGTGFPSFTYRLQRFSWAAYSVLGKLNNLFSVIAVYLFSCRICLIGANLFSMNGQS